ncbi:hypothetical protein SAMN05421505_16013 [Sinosporangium album]|uniref:Uncharacterized protein n=1 Tax=Sinosporangium album TaxID=504805 RepID=A0A1G8L300_9ACTN|nr:hypothetical protein SAMN05421505_16013 [Sinosporangium album]
MRPTSVIAAAIRNVTETPLRLRGIPLEHVKRGSADRQGARTFVAVLHVFATQIPRR